MQLNIKEITPYHDYEGKTYITYEFEISDSVYSVSGYLNVPQGANLMEELKKAIVEIAEKLAKKIDSASTSREVRIKQQRSDQNEC